MNFSWPVRVYYEDTDAGGVVYHAQYLNFMERARTEFLRSLGIEQDDLIRHHNTVFALRRMNTEFILPAVFNDMLDTETSITQMKKASLMFEQKIYRQQDHVLLCTADVHIACLNAETFKPRAIPKNILESLSDK